MATKKKTPPKKTKTTAAAKKATQKTSPKIYNYLAGAFCILGAVLHIAMGADSCQCIGGFFNFSLLYFMILLPVQVIGLFWLYMVRTAPVWMGFTILIFYLFDLYQNSQFLIDLHYADLTMCGFANNQPKYCSAAYGVSLAHIITASLIAISAITILVKLRLLKKS